MQLNAIESKIKSLENLIDRDFSNLDITVLEIEEIIETCDNVNAVLNKIGLKYKFNKHCESIKEII